ncbi:ankyrin repeat protein [Penguinpox virus]|uniref:Ankyrin repeat protein n=1 Tax=Penguinpox virus TaxID=648998 RepID=A0A068EFK6_9POXV|nr:ankyrin repeat protein [Penguinpox virus]AID46961.1 ankyrin repeat protein [Penguinpox virus]
MSDNTLILHTIMILDLEPNYNECRYCIRMLFNAVKFNNIRLVMHLLNNGVDPNFYDEYMRSPIHYAVEKGNTEMVKALLEHKADPNIFDDNFDYPITNAIIENKVEIVKVLLQYGADKTMINEFDLLHDAIKNKHVDMAKILIDNGVNLMTKDDDQYTPLHYAMLDNDTSVIYTLLNYIFKVKGYNVLDNIVNAMLCNHDLYEETTLELLISYYMIIPYLYSDIDLSDTYNNNIEVLLSSKYLSDIKNKCETEIDIMKNTIVCDDITIIDLCIGHDTNSIARNSVNLKRFTDTKLKIYRYYIEPIVEIGTCRRKLLYDAINSMNEYCRSESNDIANWSCLPFEIKYKILENIKDNEILKKI